jgi:hypothetical protein
MPKRKYPECGGQTLKPVEIAIIVDTRIFKVQ